MIEASALNKKNGSDRIFLIAVGIMLTVFTLVIRYIFKDILSIDMNIFLLPWYNDYQAAGGFKAVGQTLTNYNYFYNLLTICQTYIPIKAIYAIKALSGLFDYLLALAVMYLVSLVASSDPRREKMMLISYSVVILSPIVLENSAVWGQCDSMFAFFLVLAMIFIVKERYISLCIALGMALALKLQMVFIMPFILYVYIAKIREKKFRFIYFLLIPAVFWLTSLPHVIGGGGILDCVYIYLYQSTGQSERLYENSGCFWALFVPDSKAAAAAGIQFPILLFVLITFVILAAFFVLIYIRKTDLTYRNMVYMAFLSIFICVYFLPHMRERYGYIYEILAIVVCFLNRKTIPLLIMIYIATLARYHSYLWGMGILPVWASAAINLAALAAYFLILSKEMGLIGKKSKTSE